MDGSMRGHRPNYFVTIDDQLERKLLAIGSFASQTQVRDYLKPDLIESTARYWSRFSDGLYAEAFEVIRDSVTASLSDAPQPPAAAGLEESAS